MGEQKGGSYDLSNNDTSTVYAGIAWLCLLAFIFTIRGVGLALVPEAVNRATLISVGALVRRSAGLWARCLRSDRVGRGALVSRCSVSRRAIRQPVPYEGLPAG